MKDLSARSEEREHRSYGNRPGRCRTLKRSEPGVIVVVASVAIVVQMKTDAVSKGTT